MSPVQSEQIRLPLLLGVLLCWWPLVVGGATSSLCETACMCNERTILCDDGSKLQSIPTELPSGFDNLFIHYNAFSTSTLSASNTSGLSTVVHLKIIYSRLTRVRPRAFPTMHKLQILDLSSNGLKELEPFAFSGLRLTSLNLQDNPGLPLHKDTFGGLQVREIILRNNAMKLLHVETFQGLGLKRLLLFNNKLTSLDSAFHEVFGTSDSLLDLTHNPLYCSCSSLWYVEHLREVQAVTRLQQQSSDVNVTCHTPRRLQDRPVHLLTEKDLDCGRVRIQEVAIEWSGSAVPQARLWCRASAGDHPAWVSWATTGEMEQNEDTQRNLSKAVANTNFDQGASSLQCRAWSTKSESSLQPDAHVVVSITLPKDWTSLQNQSTAVSTSPFPISSDLDDRGFFVQRRFTLMELVLAILGTGVATLTVTCLLVQSRALCRLGCVNTGDRRFCKDISQQQQCPPQQVPPLPLLRGPTAPAPLLQYGWSGHASPYPPSMENSLYDVPQTSPQLPGLPPSNVPSTQFYPQYRSYTPCHFLDFKTQQKLATDAAIT